MRYLLPILFAVLLSACGSDEKGGEMPRKNSEPAVAASQPASKPAEPAKQPAKAAVEEVAPPQPAAETVDKAEPAVPAKKAAERVKTEKKPQKVVQAPPKTKLDLSLPKELAAQLDAENRAADDGLPPILPAFFEEKKPSLNPFQLSGKLLTGESGTEFSNSVEGAELHFEFRR
ncbi:hypothetical protein K5Q02_18950 [Pseudomonas sp. MM211]|uniref:hypothetical protein n=1 Tax=Pseudomonas sp. MM211 TaxID=2866808 RepID=UPI001CEC72E2|nr:hypothetical protein [Pseudomonas sp. MM211]UCJ15886.1 hypothetical protein K5Q02_18950 [Pseudomonas sp. MM211]